MGADQFKSCGCGTDMLNNKKDANTLSPSNALKMEAKENQISGSRTRFKFLLNDKEILLSPSIDTSINSQSNTFVFHDIDTNENALSIPTYQLHNTSSMDAEDNVDDRPITPMTEVDNPDNPVNAKTASITSNHSTLDLPKHKHKPNLYRSDTAASWDFSDMEDLQDEMNQQLQSLTQVNIIKHNNNQSMILHHDGADNNAIDSDIGTHDPLLLNVLLLKELLLNASDDKGEVANENEDGHDMMSYSDYNHLFQKIKNKGYSRNHTRSSSLNVNHMKTDTIVSFNRRESGDNDHGSKHISRGSNLVQTLSCDWDSDDMESEENQMKKHLNYLKKENSNSPNHISQMHVL